MSTPSTYGPPSALSAFNTMDLDHIDEDEADDITEENDDVPDDRDSFQKHSAADSKQVAEELDPIYRNAGARTDRELPAHAMRKALDPWVRDAKAQVLAKAPREMEQETENKILEFIVLPSKIDKVKTQVS